MNAMILNVPLWERRAYHMDRPPEKILLNAPLWERKNAHEKARAVKRKKIAVFAITICLLSIFAVINCLFCDFELAFAGNDKSEEEIKEELSGVVDDTIDELDLKAFEEFLAGLSDEKKQAIGIEDVKQTLRALVSGNSQNFFEQALGVLGKSLGAYFLGFLPGCVTIVIICLLKILLGGLTGDFASNSTTEVVHLVCYIAIIIVLMSGVASVISTATRTIDSLTTFAAAIFPALVTLLFMLGGATSAATYTPFMAAMSSVIMKLVSAFIVPAFVATAVLGVVGNLSKNVKLDKLTKLIRSASTWLIGIVFGLFATVPSPIVTIASLNPLALIAVSSVCSASMRSTSFSFCSSAA